MLHTIFGQRKSDPDLMVHIEIRFVPIDSSPNIAHIVDHLTKLYLNIFSLHFIAKQHDGVATIDGRTIATDVCDGQFGQRFTVANWIREEATLIHAIHNQIECQSHGIQIVFFVIFGIISAYACHTNTVKYYTFRSTDVHRQRTIFGEAISLVVCLCGELMRMPSAGNQLFYYRKTVNRV